MSAKSFRITQESHHSRRAVREDMPRTSTLRPAPALMPPLVQATLDVSAMQSTVRVLAIVAIVACFSLLASVITLAIILYLIASSSEARSRFTGSDTSFHAPKLERSVQMNDSLPQGQAAPEPALTAPR